MLPLQKATVTVLAAGVFAALLSAVTVAQNPTAGGKPSDVPPGDTLLLPELVTLDWIEVSKVAALREGVVDKMELQIGMPVERGKPIGYLQNEIAGLTVKKAQVAVRGVATENKAKAQSQQAAAVVARNQRLNTRIPDAVSKEDVAKAEAELKIADAMIGEAIEKRDLDKAELALAQQTLEEHTIRAPFNGLIIDRFKQPGERVGVNEPVVRVGNLDRLRAWGYVPLRFAFRIKEGMIVEIQPKLIDGSDGGPQPIERKRFRGKITFIDPQLQPVAETAVRIIAEFDNKDHELRPNLKAVMTIYLDSDAGAPATAVGNRPGLPPLPR